MAGTIRLTGREGTLSRRLRHPGAWRRRALAAALPLLALSAVVVLGHAAVVDQFTVDELMPYRDRPPAKASLPDQLMSPLAAVGREINGAVRLLFVITVPAAPLVATVASAAAALLLARRGFPERAAAWGVVLVGATVTELVMKTAIERPLLHQFDTIRDTIVSKESFNHAFPSGHTLRGLMLAVLVAELAPRLRTWLAVWFVAMSAALVLTSMHTPIDIVGGVLLSIVFLQLLEPVEERIWTMEVDRATATRRSARRRPGADRPVARRPP